MEDDPIICLCNNIRETEILYAIKFQGIKTLDSIQNETGAGTVRGCCIKSLESILEKELKKI